MHTVKGGNSLHPCRLEPSVGAQSKERNCYFFTLDTRHGLVCSCIASLPAMRKKIKKIYKREKHLWNSSLEASVAFIFQYFSPHSLLNCCLNSVIDTILIVLDTIVRHHMKQDAYEIQIIVAHWSENHTNR